MNKKIFLYLAIFGSISVQAQERWSLRQCIDYAIEHNISIRQTANAAEQSAVEVNTAKWARLPNLNASAGQSWNWGRTQTAIKNEDTGDYSTVYVNTSSHGTNMSVNTSIPIFTGLEIPHQYALAKLNLKAAIADLDKAKEDIAINIAPPGGVGTSAIEQRAICPHQPACRLGKSLSGRTGRSQSTCGTRRDECSADKQQL